MIPFFRRNGRLMLAGIAVSLFCFALSALFTAQSAVPTGSWGLSFRTEGQPPIGNATAAALRNYDAVYVGDPGEKVIYLTFDAGYENGNVVKILDTLKEKNVRGAFFILGNLVTSSTELVKRMGDEGHLVCNHTYRHRDMSKFTDKAEFAAELASLEEAYRKATGRELSKYYRPPEGRFSERNLEFAADLGYSTIFGALRMPTGITTSSLPRTTPCRR